MPGGFSLRAPEVGDLTIFVMEATPDCIGTAKPVNFQVFTWLERCKESFIRKIMFALPFCEVFALSDCQGRFSLNGIWIGDIGLRKRIGLASERQIEEFVDFKGSFSLRGPKAIEARLESRELDRFLELDL